MSSTWRVLTYATAPLYAVGYFSQLADFCIILDNFFVVHIAVSPRPSSIIVRSRHILHILILDNMLLLFCL
ncbi:hypothetical protein T08_11918 [Trichinella sp. T8]|nr:hypothetical protein T08_11918 [Trichinella sp. T8]